MKKVKRKIKRLEALLLCLAMLFTTIPSVTAYAGGSMPDAQEGVLLTGGETLLGEGAFELEVPEESRGEETGEGDAPTADDVEGDEANEEGGRSEGEDPFGEEDSSEDVEEEPEEGDGPLSEREDGDGSEGEGETEGSEETTEGADGEEGEAETGDPGDGDDAEGTDPESDEGDGDGAEGETDEAAGEGTEDEEDPVDEAEGEEDESGEGDPSDGSEVEETEGDGESGQGEGGAREAFAALGLSPYENWFYGEPGCSGNTPYVREGVEYFTQEAVDELNERYGSVADGVTIQFTDDLAVIASMLQEGMDPYRFFYGTVLYPMGADELIARFEEGRTLEELLDEAQAPLSEGLLTLRSVAPRRYLSDGGEAREFSVLSSPLRAASAAQMQVIKMTKASPGVLGHAPQLADEVISHGAFWFNQTTDGVALCLTYGGSCRQGYVYYEIPASEMTDRHGVVLSQAKINAVRAAAEVYEAFGGSVLDYQLASYVTWWVMNNDVSTDMDLMGEVYPGLRLAIYNANNQAVGSNPDLEPGGATQSWLENWWHRFRRNEGVDGDRNGYVYYDITLKYWKCPANANAQKLVTWDKGTVIDRKSGYLRVVKEDEDGRMLSGCTFAIFDSDMKTVVDVFTTTDAPYVKELPVGTYWLKETACPDLYELDGSFKRIVITKDNTVTAPFHVNLVNRYKMPKARVWKLEKGLASVVTTGLASVQVINAATGGVVTEILVGVNGAVTVDLPAGNYYLHEVAPAPGYVLSGEDVYFTIPDDPVSVTDVRIYNAWTTVYVNKLEAGTGNHLSGALLQLYKVPDGTHLPYQTLSADQALSCVSGFELVESWVTDGSTREIKKLEAGRQYVLYEAEVPEGYKRAEAAVFTVPENETPLTITMYDSPRILSIVKRDSSTGTNLGGCVLQLWEMDGEGNKTVMIDEWNTTDSNPHVISGIEPKKYVVVEVSCPDSYESFGEKIIEFGHQHDASCIGETTTLCPGSGAYVKGGWYHGAEAYPGAGRCAQCWCTDKIEGSFTDDGKQIFACWHPWYNCPSCGDGHCGTTTDTPESTSAPTFHIEDHYVVSQAYVCGLEEGDAVGDQEIVVYNNRIGDEMYAYVDKTNVYGTIHVAGATLAIYSCDDEGNRGDLFERWVSDGTTHKTAAIRPGRYLLLEEAAPAGYVTADPIYFEVKDASVSVRIREENTILQVKKVDAEGNTLAGCDLEIWTANERGEKESLYKAFTTGRSDSVNVVTGIPVGRYVLVEKKAPEGYALAEDVPFTVSDVPGVQTVVMRDEPITVEISKKDVATGEELAGATLEVWALSDSGVPTKMIERWTSTGEAHLMRKPAAGKYLLRETYAPAGYVKSADVTFTVEATGGVQKAEMKDDFIKASFDKTDVHTDGKVVGAVMGLYVADEAGNRVSLYETWVTDGTPHNIDRLPAGKYVLLEITPPDGYLPADPIVITVTETAKRQEFALADDYDYVRVVILKADGVTGQEIPAGAEFAVYEWNEGAGGYERSKTYKFLRKADGSYVVKGSLSWMEEGCLYYSPDNAGKFYVLEEKAPYGYEADPDPVYLSVLDKTPCGADGVTICVTNADPSKFPAGAEGKFLNAPAALTLTIKKADGKTGELIPSGAEFALFEWSEKAGAYAVSEHYRIEGLGGGTYGVRNDFSYGRRDAIYYTQDNQGKFYYVETKAPDGYLLDDAPVYFVLDGSQAALEGGNADPAAYQIGNASLFANEKTRHLFRKTDAVTGRPVSGATLQVLEVIGREAGEYKTRLVEEWESDASEVHYFVSKEGILLEVPSPEDLPEGTEVITKKGHLVEGLIQGKAYLLREVKAPAGYATAEDLPFFALDDGSVREIRMKDERTKLYVSKRDVTTGEELPGATLQIWTGDEKTLLCEWVSETEPHYVEMLPAGEYVLVESIPAPGYVTAKKVRFVIEDSGVPQRVEMTDDVTKVLISKKDLATGEELPGATLQIWSLADDGKKKELICEWVSEDKPRYLEKLPIGDYVLVETIPAPGYVTAAEVKFSILDDGEIQKAEMLDDVTKVLVSKKDLTSMQELPGATMQIWSLDAGLNKVKLMEEWVSGNEPHLVERLPIGTYALVEAAAPEGFLVSGEVIFAVSDAPEVQSVTMTDDYTKLYVSKRDVTTTEELPGATLQLWSVGADGEAENLIEEWVSEGEPHYVRGLAPGRYLLRETIPAPGYVTAQEMEFLLPESGEPVTVEMVDDVTKVLISKKDLTTKDELPGATLQLWSATKDGEAVDLIEEWVSESEPHYVEMLPVGFYLLVETIPAKGYFVNKEPVLFEVLDDAAVQSFEMFNDYTKLQVIKVGSDGATPLEGATLQLWKVTDAGERTEMVEEWVTTSEPRDVTHLPAGWYLVVETAAPNGYVLGSPMLFELKETGEVQKVTFRNDKKETPPPADLEMADLTMKQTGEAMSPLWYLALALAAVMLGCALYSGARKRDEEE